MKMFINGTVGICALNWIKKHMFGFLKYSDRKTMARAKEGIRYTRIIFFFVMLLFFVCVLKNIKYLMSEFILKHNINVETCETCSMKHWNEVFNTKRISNNIHQIYFPVKSKTMSRELTEAHNSWKIMHKNFTHYLWNETSVIRFIRKNYPHLEPLYSSYDYWVRRVNVARYLILYHYGGWYVDLDMTCVKSLSGLADRAARLNKSVVQHYTFPVGTSNDFFGITPKHQFLKSVLDHLPNSNKWFIFPYFNTVLTTGTTYMWGRYLNYPHKKADFMILGEEEIKAYIRHHHHSAWHGWDAMLIRFIVQYTKLTFVFIVLFVVLCLLWLVKSKRIYK